MADLTSFLSFFSDSCNRKPRRPCRVRCVAPPVCWQKWLTSKTVMSPWTSSVAAVVWWHSKSRPSAHQVPQDSDVCIRAAHNWTFSFIKLAFFLIGARLCCDNCGKHTVPAYHLAMSDTSIRNFCTLPCVMAFQVQLSLCLIKTS